VATSTAGRTEGLSVYAVSTDILEAYGSDRCRSVSVYGRTRSRHKGGVRGVQGVLEGAAGSRNHGGEPDFAKSSRLLEATSGKPLWPVQPTTQRDLSWVFAGTGTRESRRLPQTTQRDEMCNSSARDHEFRASQQSCQALRRSREPLVYHVVRPHWRWEEIGEALGRRAKAACPT
jgi:hypothetical protein